MNIRDVFIRLPAGPKKKPMHFCITGLINSLAIFLFILAAANISYAATIDLNGIETLLKNKNYSAALEKALDILNTKQSLLAPGEAGKLYYLIGIAYKKNGNTDMASTYLKKIESQFPTSEYVKQSLLELADIYIDDDSQRETYLEKVFEKFPKTPEAIYAGIELSKSYFNVKDFKKAAPLIEKMVKVWNVGKDYPELEFLLAKIYAGMGNYTQAVIHLKNAENKIPKIIENNPSYLLEAGKIYYNNWNLGKAETYLTKLINVYPSYTDIDEAAIILAQAYAQEKNSFMSAVFLIKVLSNNPTDEKKQYNLLLNLGKILGTLKVDELEKIKANYPRYWDAKKLLTLVKDNSPDSNQKRSAAILLGSEFEKAGDFKQATDNYYRFLETKRDPLVEKHFKEGLDVYLDFLLKSKNDDEILKLWVLIKERKSYLSATNLLKLGSALFDMKLYGGAQEIYSFMDQYTMFSQYWPTVRQQLARLYFKIGQFDEYLNIRAKIMMDNAAEPEKSEFLYYTLEAYKKMGSSEELNKTLKTITVNPQKIENVFQFKILSMKAEAMGEEKDPTANAAALHLYKKLSNYKGLTTPLELDLLVKTGDLNVSLGNWESALQNYNNAEDFLVSGINGINDTGKSYKEWILFRKIYIYQHINRPGDANKMLTELKKVNPTSFWVQQAEKIRNKNVD